MTSLSWPRLVQGAVSMGTTGHGMAHSSPLHGRGQQQTSPGAVGASQPSVCCSKQLVSKQHGLPSRAVTPHSTFCTRARLPDHRHCAAAGISRAHTTAAQLAQPQHYYPQAESSPKNHPDLGPLCSTRPCGQPGCARYRATQPDVKNFL